MVKLKALFQKKFYASYIGGLTEKKNFRNIRLYCMFIGYQRSGHSFLGALLDAHPNVSVGMEVDVLNLVELGYKRFQIYYIIVNNARIFKRILKNIWTGYNYSVSGLYQGTYENLQVIGDKKGGKSTLRLGENPILYDKLLKITGVNIKIFHVIRNPFDNISTMMLRYMEKGNPFDIEIFKSKIDLYFRKVEINRQLKESGKMDILDIYHEEFIANPEKILEQILKFLELGKNSDYITKCSALVYQTPNKSRHKLTWPPDLKKMIENKILQYPFLKHYRFDD